MMWMSDKAKLLFYFGIIIVLAGSVVVGISWYNYARYNKQIDDGVVVPLLAKVTYYDEDWEYVGIGDNRRRKKVCELDIEYEYEDQLYDDSTDECWSGAYTTMRIDIFVNPVDPEDYFFERDATSFAFTSVWMPLLGIGFIVVAYVMERSYI